jgi:hypothetical protein
MLLLRKTNFLIEVSDASFERTTNDRRRSLVSSTIFANNGIKTWLFENNSGLFHDLSKLSEYIGSKQIAQMNSRNLR